MPANPALAYHPALTGAEQYGGAMEPAQKPDVAGLVQALGSARDAMGGSIADRMAHHGAQQQARMASGNFSPTPVTADSMDLADSVAGGLVGNIGLAAAIKAYHGSPHRFDRFDMSKIGTGEGAQAYGSGLYFAESPDVARSYRSQLTTGARTGSGRGRTSVFSAGGQDLPVSRSVEADIAHTMQKHGIDPTTPDGVEWLSSEIGARSATAARDVDADAVKELWRSGPIEQRYEDGALYTTRLDVEPEDLLDWDAPLSQQSEKVQRALMNLPNAHKFKPEWTGAQLYEASLLVPGDVRDKKAATAVLQKAGIPGIRYLDQGSRASGEGTRNFVIFDDKLIDIEGVE